MGHVCRRLAALAGRAGEAPAQRVRQVASRCSAPGLAPQPPFATQVSNTFLCLTLVLKRDNLPTMVVKHNVCSIFRALWMELFLVGVGSSETGTKYKCNPSQISWVLKHL